MQPLSFLSLVGATLSVFLAVRLVVRPSENRAAAVALAAFLGCCALFVLDVTCYREAWWAKVPWFYGVANPFTAAITPWFYLYTRAALTPGFRWRSGHALHFLPALVLLLLQSPVFFAPVAVKLQLAVEDFDVAKRREQLGVLLAIEAYFWSYLGAAWWHLWRARDRTAESREEGRTHPVRGIGLFATLLFVAGATSSVLDYTRWAETGGVVAVLTVVLAVFVLLWLATEPRPFLVPSTAGTQTPPPETSGADQAATPAAPTPGAVPAVPPASAAATVAPDAPEEERRTGSDLPAAEAQRIAAKVRRLLESEKLYLEADLSLHVLAEKAQTTRHKLSAALRIGCGATFHQLVSGYRVREAARVLASREGNVRTIADIAFAAGFNTLSAFNAAFRAQFDMTPREYRDRAATARKT